MEYVTTNIDNLIAKVATTNDIAQKPARFCLGYPKDKIIMLLGGCYKAQALKRVTAEKYLKADGELLRNISDVSEWLTDPDKRFGILLYGKVGTGKTTLLNAMCQVVNMLCKRSELPSGYKEKTLDNSNVISVVKAKHIIDCFVSDNNRYRLMCTTDLLAIDELGVEPTESKMYGNTSEPLIDLFCERYERQKCTMVSTNLGFDEIRKRYGSRLADRFNEMFAMIPFNGNSYRQ